MRGLARWVVTHLFRVTVTGLENIPKPPFIIAANHQAWFDPAFIIPFFPQRPLIYTMAKTNRDCAPSTRSWSAGECC
ncbi:MAG: 1-acyl-sn-glycerol-3-phosphate acyltransferase [Chloroflexi bacterium]|nr:MAG: 1-acyl-sn-glycerol-3-phosphate acyltransferase [Chloroflexota bacterium]